MDFVATEAHNTHTVCIYRGEDKKISYEISH